MSKEVLTRDGDDDEQDSAAAMNKAPERQIHFGHLCNSNLRAMASNISGKKANLFSLSHSCETVKQILDES